MGGGVELAVGVLLLFSVYFFAGLACEDLVFINNFARQRRDWGG